MDWRAKQSTKSPDVAAWIQERLCRIAFDISDDFLSARAPISANGYVLQVEAKFPKEGEYWETLSNHYCGMDPKTRPVVLGDEWGIRHDGTGIVSIRKKNGKVETFEAYVGLDTQLGWDYRF